MFNFTNHRNWSEICLALTLPRSPLSLDRKPPLFFTATSSVLLCTSGNETLKSKLKQETRALLNFTIILLYFLITKNGISAHEIIPNVMFVFYYKTEFFYLMFSSGISGRLKNQHFFLFPTHKRRLWHPQMSGSHGPWLTHGGWGASLNMSDSSWGLKYGIVLTK